nr:E-beta-farnesene synthase [Tanacetum cinerariifolium]
MADVNVNAPADQAPTMAPPTRTDDQILPHIRWQFWDTVRYDKTAGCYICQLDEQWFDLTKDTLRDSLQITPVNNNKAFSSPLSSNALINFVNELGYPKLVRNLSNVVTNDMFQPWRALTTIINMCLTRKTSGFERFTKLIIYHLQRKHKFHPGLDSSLHLPNEELVLGYLKFSNKGTKKEVFGMPIPGNLITTDIHGESYYQEYLAKVAKHQRYPADETGSDPDSLASKPTKATKKSKPSAPKVALRPPVTKPASSQQTEPQPTPAKSQGKKLKLVTKISNKPSPARKSTPGLVSKRRKPISSLRSVDESAAEGIPEKEPRVDDEEVDVQRALEESLKKVQGKGKEKVTDEHVARDLLTLQTPKKKSPAEDVLGIDVGVQGEGHAGPNPEDYDKGQVRPNPDEQDEGQAGPNPDDVVASQPLPTESMMSVTIQQDTSSIPPMKTPIIDLTSIPESLNVHHPIQATTTTTIHPPPSQLQQSTMDSMLMKRIGELEHIIENLIQGLVCRKSVFLSKVLQMALIPLVRS